MKTLRMANAVAALMMAAILMTAAGQAEAKKRAPATPPAVISTDMARPALRPAGRYPEDRGIGAGHLTIERDGLWMVLKHRFWN